MVVISSLLDTVLGLAIMGGSPAVGYILLRFIIPETASWVGWKRMMVGTIIGIGGSGVLLFSLPSVPNEMLSPLLIGEWAWWGGMGIILLAIVTRAGYWVSHRGMTHLSLSGTHPEPTQEYSVEKLPRISSFESASRESPVSTRPRAYPSPIPKKMEEPVLENDVLDLLKSESARDQNNSGGISHAPSKIVAFGTSERFEDTLDQLKKDLKDFNESMSTKGRKVHEEKKHE